MNSPGTHLRRQPLSLSHLRIPFLPILAGLSCTGLFILLGVVIWLGLEWLRLASNPYQMSSTDSIGAVRSLLPEGMEFDIGMSVFAVKAVNVTERPECTYEERLRWKTQGRNGNVSPSFPEETIKQYDSQMGPAAPCDYLYVPETEWLWSGIVARSLTLANKRVEADVTFDIPAESLYVTRSRLELTTVWLRHRMVQPKHGSCGDIKAAWCRTWYTRL